jgi:hypothetical protein
MHLIFLAALALAEEESQIFLSTSPTARVEVLPTHGPEWFEIAVLDNRVSLRDQMPRSIRYVRNIETVAVGSGTTYVRIQAERDDLELTADASVEGLLLKLAVGSGVRAMEKVMEPAPYEVLVGTTPPLRRRRALDALPIFPLIGDARTYRPEPDAIPLGVEDWTGVGLEHLPLQLQAKPTGWFAADGFREVLTGPSTRDEQGIARLLLAQTYLAKGIPHEAAYYLDAVIGQSGPWHPALPHLQMARAQIGRGDFDAAAEQCRAAAARRGDELVVLRCLGAVAVQTGSPAPRHLALAIEQRATDGRSLLLAAELMMADLDHAAANRLAVEASKDLKGRTLGHAKMIVGDTAFFTGKPELASEAWAVAARNGFSGLVDVRRSMAQLATKPRRTWSREVPYLEKLALRSGGELEARYLLGQIAEYFPDPEEAARQYHAVWDASATTAYRSDIPERLVAMCDRYAGHLKDEERWTDLAVFARVCWRSDLDRLAADTSLSESWARAYLELGLVDDALRVQRRVVRVRNELEREEVGPLIRLASLYTRSGRPNEALETVEYVKERMTGAARTDPRLLLRQAEAHAALDDPAAARRLWTAALRSPSVEPVARRALGLLDAYEGKCAAAVLRLTTADASQRLARSRCALDLGNAAEAELEASDVMINGDDAFIEEASWLLGASAFAQRRTDAVEEAEGGAALWAAVLAEEAEAQAFGALLRER